MTTSAAQPSSATATGEGGERYFEDFAVGQRFTSATREVTQRDPEAFTEISGDAHPLHTDPSYAATTRFARPVLQGPFGIAVVAGLFHDLAVVDSTVIAMLDTHWRYLQPIHVGDTLHFEMTITRCRRSSSGDRGVVNRHVALIDQHGQRVQEGTTAVLVQARETRDPSEDPVGCAFGTAAWGEALARRLEADREFGSATASWDGTFGLRCGEDEVHLRVYRGRVLEATRRAPLGATFTVEADELTWTELLTGPRNDFTHRAMRGQFRTRGSGYDYLRFTKALTVLVDNARSLATEETR
ncbi:acyl dehydratase [Halopolyspora algeriensis]|uniref:Acyl dehydratase n=1 Tax=Halopolyspora algeriensis TaxID=1500506 RepID=A0A368VV83_9ACTN|nr:MaoC/PaaZ C-terminal domain-containing protein [Halopolyspora algeriensis]RCW45759.1 acyl dehydratase [Halopolyspora algeriensis]TQM54143.1 acyl dehydratase [Halopolyspora algeriensis]